MAPSPKKMPEIDLPPLFSTTIVAYLGARGLRQLSPAQRQSIMSVIQTTANAIADIMAAPPAAEESLESYSARRKGGDHEPGL